MKKICVVAVVLLLLALSVSACGSKAERPEQCKWFESTNKCIVRLNGNIPVSWKDAVTYAKGGSGPADPAGVFESDQTAVDHSNRLIVENPDLAVRECFPEVSDEIWKAVVAWADQWGADSPTRIEWQTNESRCSFVFPGNITDSISEEDYEKLLALFPGYETWFVGGDEGSEFGRKTYAELIALDATFNRVHIYGPTLPAMPTN